MAKIEKQPQVKTKKFMARQQREERQTRTILIITIAIGVVILGLLFYGIVDQLIVKPRTQVARVGDTVIRVKSFESTVQYSRVQTLNQAYQFYTYAGYLGDYGQSYLNTALEMVTELNNHVSYASNVLNEMVDNEIVRQEATARGLVVTEEEIDNALKAAFGFFPNGTPTPTQTATLQSTPTLSATQLSLVNRTPTQTEIAEEAVDSEIESEAIVLDNVLSEDKETVEIPEEILDKFLVDESLAETTTPEPSPTITPTPTVFTTEIFGQNIKDFNDLYKIYNFDIDDLRAIFEVDLLRRKLVEEIAAGVHPYKDEVWARHILVGTIEEAQDILQMLADGKDWHELAAEMSTDTSNKDLGGDLGWFDQQTMVEPFSQAAFNLEVGEISDPVATDFGYHIIQVLGKRETQLSDSELLSKKNDVFVQWLKEQRSERDDIVIYDNWENFAPQKPQVPVEFLTQLYQLTVQ